ncbi:MAG: hypothetical protein H6718_10385 [Polyangiaceae bacterium]|nr:hypothetical protein [Myxococcales bacterium]MCB9585799.1 hypothetical protein [Polyangiaceae bacterium]
MAGATERVLAKPARENSGGSHGHAACICAIMENTLTTNRNQSVHDKVNHRVDEVTTSVGQSAQVAADRVREADLTERAAGSLENVGSYLEGADYDQLVEDVTAVVKRHPIPAILAGVGLGYLIGRLTS